MCQRIGAIPATRARVLSTDNDRACNVELDRNHRHVTVRTVVASCTQCRILTMTAFVPKWNPLTLIFGFCLFCDESWVYHVPLGEVALPASVLAVFKLLIVRFSSVKDPPGILFPKNHLSGSISPPNHYSYQLTHLTLDGLKHETLEPNTYPSYHFLPY